MGRPGAGRSRMSTVAIIGYGEVGRILAEDLRARGVAVTAYDLKLGPGDAASAKAADAMRRHAGIHGTTLAASHAAAVDGAPVVISAVTASQAVPVAEACAPALAPRATFVDMNSASPGAKRRAAAVVDAAGARYVEAAVMTSVPPHRLAVPMLLGGPHAAAAVPVLQGLGFANARLGSVTPGVVSATKLCRSVVIKGLEAMLIESFTAARHHGVEDAVIASLAETFPGIDWERQATYFFQRVIEHGRRRAEELEEAAATVREAGLQPFSAAGTVARQAGIADLADAGVFGDRSAHGFARAGDWRVEADRLLAAGPRHAADPEDTSS